MLRSFLERHSRADSPIHRLPAGFKLAAVITLVAVTALLPRGSWPAFIAIGALLLATALLSLTPPAYLLRRLALVEPFVFGIALLSLFQSGGTQIFLGILTKSTICLFAVILLAATTTFTDLLAVLRRAHIPGIFVTTLALMYRYLFLLIEESARMRRARLSRQFTHHRAHVWHSLATVAGQLFIRGTERAERIYSAMCARGWNEDNV